VNSDMFIVS